MTSVLLARAPAHVRARPPSPAPHAILQPLRGGQMLVVREESSCDIAARERLLDAAFGPARFLKTSEALRAGRLPARGLALSGFHDGELVATVRLWSIHAGGVPALLLGPLAVAESRRSLGVGAAMMEAAIARASALGHKAIILVGDEPYYRRFGFSPALTARLDMPGPVERERFLALELQPRALDDAAGMIVAAGLRAGARRRSADHRRKAA